MDREGSGPDPHRPVDHSWHAARVTDATYRDGGCSNNDTLYSLAGWFAVELGEPHCGGCAYGRFRNLE
jgi:hypothetical protein